MNTFHFLFPVVLYALILLPVLLWRLLLAQNCFSPWQKVCDPALYDFLVKRRVEVSDRLPIYLFLLGLCFAIVAFAGPSWKAHRSALYESTQARVIVLDLSETMSARDIVPSRLTRAKYKVRDLLAAMHEGQVGLIVFSGEPFVVSPLTQDTQTIDAMMPMITQDIMPIAGKEVGPAIDKARELLQQAGSPTGDILLLSDSPIDPSALQAAKEAKAAGYRLSALGIGTQTGVPIPLPEGGFETDASGRMTLYHFSPEGLKNLVRTGGGRYVNFTDNDADVQSLLQSHLPHQGGQKTQSVWERFEDEGHWFVLPILVISLWGFRRAIFETL